MFFSEEPIRPAENYHNLFPSSLLLYSYKNIAKRTDEIIRPIENNNFAIVENCDKIVCFSKIKICA